MASNTATSKKRKAVATKANNGENLEAPQKKHTKPGATHNVQTNESNGAPVTRQGGKSVAEKQAAAREQGAFLIHCRDNLVPGSTAPKDWHIVAEEFNEKFKDDLRKALAWNTLQKRTTEARKWFEVENPDYEVKYPVPSSGFMPVAQPGSEEDEDEDKMDIDDAANNNEIRPHGKEAPPTTNLRPTIEAQMQEPSAQDQAPKTQAPKWHDQHPGAYILSSVAADHILPIDRVKYHLRRRSDDLATFRLLAADADDADEHKSQYVDHDDLRNVSPLYAQFARSDPDRPIEVPEQFCADTINAFIQLISPIRVTSLPTHYLWHSEVPLAGVYDRFGGITPELIHWGVDELLELYAFARYMEVFWIRDMVIDRLHWMFTEQKKTLNACAGVSVSADGSIELNSEKLSVDGRLPYVPDLKHCSISAEDISTLWLARLGTAPADVQMLTFIADLMHALDGAPDKNWLRNSPNHIQDIFTSAAQATSPNIIENGSRPAFCSKYHHHTTSEPCYTITPSRLDNQFIHQLYATSSRDELLALSSGVAPPNSLASIMYAASGAKQELKAANSSAEILEAEEMVLEMEMRLGRAKMALAVARSVEQEEKGEMVGEAKKVALGMFRETSVLRK